VKRCRRVGENTCVTLTLLKIRSKITIDSVSTTFAGLCMATEIAAVYGKDLNNMPAAQVITGSPIRVGEEFTKLG
jgi:hypothetical protein